MHHDYRSFLEAKAPLAQPAGLPCSIAYLREAEREAAVPTLFDLLAADGDAGEERQDAA